MAKKTEKSGGDSAENSNLAATIVAIIAATSWCWAFAQLATRQVHILDYFILHPAAPAWGFIGLPIFDLLMIVVTGCLLGRGCFDVAMEQQSICPSPCKWLFGSILICFADVVRLGFPDLPCTMAEPLFLTAITGFAVAAMIRGLPDRDKTFLKTTAGALAIVAPIGAFVLWYGQGEAAYNNFMLGYHDVGHFARRVVNTWEGRGFLLETPSLPPFWDHFNPGLVLLTPIWAVWPDPKLFIVLQAFCLAVPAYLVYGIARQFGADTRTATLWSIAYLFYPAVGQLNLNYGYGWHPVSMALPLMFASIFFVLRGHHVFAAVTIVLACSFNEVVIVVTGCVAALMAIFRFFKRPSGSNTDLFVEKYRWQVWLAIWAICTIGFALVWAYAGFSQFQGQRIASQLSLHNAFQYESLWFVLALLAPLGSLAVFYGLPFLLALVLPIGVLVTWSYEHSTSISFQYTSTLIPILFAATISDSAVQRTRKNRASSPSARSMLSAAMAAVAAGFVASTLFGTIFVWSRPTLEVLQLKTYPGQNNMVHTDRQPGSDGLKELSAAVEMANEPQTSVLATGNVALHLLRVRRLESVNEAADGRRMALATEAGAGRAWIELFDWIVLDTQEDFQQGTELTNSVINEAKQLGYETVRERHGVVVLRRPG